MKRAYKRAVWESIPTALLIFDERWNYKEGFDVAKENDRILVVRCRADIESPLSEMLNYEMPNAIWLTVKKSYYDATTVGDRISISIGIRGTGTIDMSFPVEAKEELKIMIKLTGNVSLIKDKKAAVYEIGCFCSMSNDKNI
ncbi:hypothetical protein [Paenibacillus sp. NPDC093718]|uniref:hypothetical protein n=1 Tax=Paenibacillus sp. NPDC093718 TaxID=3390601 RepID=UPI003D038F45